MDRSLTVGAEERGVTYICESMGHRQRLERRPDLWTTCGEGRRQGAMMMGPFNVTACSMTWTAAVQEGEAAGRAGVI